MEKGPGETLVTGVYSLIPEKRHNNNNNNNNNKLIYKVE